MAQLKPVEQLTVKDIKSMTVEELMQYQTEDLLKMAEIAGVSMEELMQGFDPTVSIASKQEENYFNTPISTSVLTAKDIERSGVTSIPEAMRLIPGVLVREKTNGNYDVQITNSSSIVGLPSLFSENAMTAVMLNGRPVYSYITGGMFWESLPVSIYDIDRIEVIRGAASAMYGANAVNGVINIITKSTASEKVSGQASGALGGYFNGASPMAGRGNGSLYLSTLINVNEKLRFKLSANNSFRDRSQSDIFFYYTGRLTIFGNTAKYYPLDSVSMFGIDPRAMYRDVNRSSQVMGINGYMYYSPSNNISLDLSAGTQQSYAISSNLDLYFLAHTERDINSHYIDLKANLFGINVQGAYTWGSSDLSRNIPGMKNNTGNLFINAEYSYKWNSMLVINPGFNYVRTTLDSSPYKAENQTYFDGLRTLSSWAPSLRIDVRPCDKLRLMAALRLEKNAVPNRFSPTWQMVANYIPNEKTIFRMNVARANRSPFMTDVMANSSIETINGPEHNLTQIGLEGNHKLKLTTADMIELGFRRKISQRVLFNLELYYTKLKNQNTPILAELRENFTDVRPDKVELPYYLHYRFENLPEVQYQWGATTDVGVVLSEKLTLRLFGTLQYTKVNKHMDADHKEPQSLNAEGKHTYIPSMIGYSYKVGNEYLQLIVEGKTTDQAEKLLLQKYFYAEPDKLHVTFDDIKDEISYVSIRSKAMPSFYGGFELHWNIYEKLEFVSTGYGYTRHEYSNVLMSMNKISPKFLLNGNLNYQMNDNMNISLTVNNILNQTKPEYGFMDKVGTQWFIGVNCKF